MKSYLYHNNINYYKTFYNFYNVQYKTLNLKNKKLIINLGSFQKNSLKHISNFNQILNLLQIKLTLINLQKLLPYLNEFGLLKLRTKTQLKSKIHNKLIKMIRKLRYLKLLPFKFNYIFKI